MLRMIEGNLESSETVVMDLCDSLFSKNFFKMTHKSVKIAIINFSFLAL